MADITKRLPDCDDDCENGERGKRGKRGHRGHDGRDGNDGNDGATGPTGPTGLTGPTGGGTIAVSDEGLNQGNFSVLNFIGDGVTASDVGGGVVNITIPGDSPLDAAIGLRYVYRPGATGVDAPGGNVFTDWTLLMAALDATRHLGTRVLEFDDRFQSPAPIPPGVWNMTDVMWTNLQVGRPVFVELLDGASIVLDPIAEALRFDGFGFEIFSNRTGPVAPFVGFNILTGGNNVRFFNDDPAALPMFEMGEFNEFIFSGENSRGGFGFFGPPAAPLVDVMGGITAVVMGAGDIPNGVFTDTVGGGFVFILGLMDDVRSDSKSAWENPALEAAGGSIAADGILAQVRYRVNPDLLDPEISRGAPIVLAESPYPASYNSLILVDSSTGPITIQLPNALRALGERVTVKDVGGGANAITIATTYGNTIENPLISNPNGSKTWASDSLGNWWLIAQV